MIKRILLTFIIVVLSYMMLWGFWGWFIAKDSEQQLTTFLQNNFHNAKLNSIDASLLSYKTNLIGADALIKIISKVEFIREQIGELSLHAKLLNGPVFYDDGNILFGKTLWKISLNSSSLKGGISENLFKEKIPFLSVLIGFDNSLSYQSHISKLSSASLHIKDITSKGSIDKNSLSNHLNIHINDISLLTELGVVDIPALDIAINIDQQQFLLQKHIRYTVKPFVISSEKTENSNGVFQSKGNFTYINNKLSGIFELNYSSSIEPTLYVEAHNLSVEGYQSFLQVEAQILNLKQQVQWTLEEGAETPEGQAHIWQLYEQLNNKRHSISKIMTQEVFAENDSRLKLSITLPQDVSFLPSPLLLSLKEKLALFSENGLLNQVNNHYQGELKSNGNKLLINNNSISWEELLKNIQPNNEEAVN